VFETTDTVSVDEEHPSADIAYTFLIPGAFTLQFAVVYPETIPEPVQLYETPPTLEQVTIVKELAQVKDFVGPAVMVGSGLTVTVTFANPEHPVTVFVAVTV